MENNTKDIIDVEARELETKALEAGRTANRTAAITDRFLLGLDWNDIGPCVISCANGDNAAMAKKAATICRRRFRPGEVVLISLLDEDEEGESGIAFTAKGMYYWIEDDTFMDEVKYADIEDVDYDSDSVRLTLRGDSRMPEDDDADEIATAINEVRKVGRMFFDSLPYTTGLEETLKRAAKGSVKHLPCVGDDNDLDDDEICEYARGLYNFIADIVEKCSEQ